MAATMATAATMAAAATMATTATTMATTATTMATATAAAAASFHDPGTTCILLIEEMEGSDAGVSKFFLTQHDRVSLRQV
jgi:hypothetical protein